MTDNEQTSELPNTQPTEQPIEQNPQRAPNSGDDLPSPNTQRLEKSLPREGTERRNKQE